MSDAPDLRARRRVRWAVALLLTGLAVAFVPALATGEEFLESPWVVDLDPGPASLSRFSMHTVLPGTFPPTALSELICTDPAWAVAIATLLTSPLLFLWWRVSAIGFGRVAGIACCVAAAAAACALVLTRPDREFGSPGRLWTTVPIGAVLMAIAFLVAPPPRRGDDA
jgi:hypothetical protein